MSKTIIYDFLDMLVAEYGAADNTISAYERDLLQLFGFSNKEMFDITEKDIVAFIKHLSSSGYASSSILRKISALNDFFKLLRLLFF